MKGVDNNLLHKLDSLISLATDNELLEHYPTIDLLELVGSEFDKIIFSMPPLMDTDIHTDI